jgi:DNA-binding NarL/FixJ family response regulator
MAIGGTRTVIRVLVADDHALIRSALATLLDGHDDMLVVAEAENGEQAVEQAKSSRPDVVLMDLSMPVVDGVEATRRIIADDPTVQVLVLSSFSDRNRVHDALAAGAIGYLLKDSEPGTVVAGVRAAARRESPLDPRIARTLLTKQVLPNPTGVLSKREQEVLALVAEGLTNKRIGRILGITERTVKVHLGNAFRRIGVGDRTSAALWAKQHLAESDEP